HLWFKHNSIDNIYSLLSLVKVNSGNKYISVFFDVDLDFTFSGDLLDNLSARTDDLTNLINRNFCCKHFRSPLVYSRTRFRNSLKHYIVKNMKSCLMSFSKSLLDDIRSKTINLDIYLNSGDSLMS